jgi:hypothetical protein
MMFYAAVNRQKNRDRAIALGDMALATATAQPGVKSGPLTKQIETLNNA